MTQMPLRTHSTGVIITLCLVRWERIRNHQYLHIKKIYEKSLLDLLSSWLLGTPCNQTLSRLAEQRTIANVDVAEPAVFHPWQLRLVTGLCLPILGSFSLWRAAVILQLPTYKTGQAHFLLRVSTLHLGFISINLFATNFITLLDSFQKASLSCIFSPPQISTFCASELRQTSKGQQCHGHMRRGWFSCKVGTGPGDVNTNVYDTIPGEG